MPMLAVMTCGSGRAVASKSSGRVSISKREPVARATASASCSALSRRGSWREKLIRSSWFHSFVWKDDW